MILKKIPEDMIGFVSGQWGPHKIDPRLSTSGWGILPISILNNKSIPENIKSLISNCDDYEFNPQDFPQHDLSEEV